MEDRNWAAKDIPESIKGVMTELQVLHDEVEKTKHRFWEKLIPMHLFTNQDKDEAFNARFKSEVLSVLPEQQFEDVHYYADKTVDIENANVVSKYYRVTGSIDNPDLITGFKNGVPFTAGQLKISTSGVENSQTGSSSSELSFSGIVILLQNKFSVEKPVTFEPKAEKAGLLKGAMQKLKESYTGGTELENEFDKKFKVITKNSDMSFLTPELMAKPVDIREKFNYGYTIFLEDDKLFVTKNTPGYDKFGVTFYWAETLENKFNYIKATVDIMGEMVEWASELIK